MADIPYGRRLTHLAEQFGSEVAVVFAAQDGTDHPIAWDHLERRANQVADLLLERGVDEESTVVVGLRNSPEHLYATFGAWKAGASLLPLRYDLPDWERDRILELVGAAVVIADWDGIPGVVGTADLAATADRPDGPAPDRVPRCARLIASSGSTGSPKIIRTPLPGIHTETVPGSTQIVGGPGSVQLVTSPLYHVNGFAFTYTVLLNEGLAVLMERFDAARAVDLIERYRVTYTVMVPTMLQRIARLEGVGDRDFSSVGRVHYGGASIPDWVVRAWVELVPPERFWLNYGSSEAIGGTGCSGAEWLEHPGTVGLPMACDLRILDDDRREVAAGEVGEIFMRPHAGPPPFDYLGGAMPTPTEDGFWSIGDMGWVDADGYLYIADRRKDMIVTGGANVFPAEVEAALSEHPGIVDVVVVGIPDEEWGHRVHAIVQPVAGTTLGDDALRAHAKARLASYKVPKTYELVVQLPRTAAGKVNRSAIAAERSPTTTG